MFRRRLAALMGMSILATAALTAQMARLTVVQGAENRKKAEDKLLTREWTPPGGAGRGRILDRKGRILAQDRPSLDVQAEYGVLSGPNGEPPPWVMHKAAVMARRHNAELWKASGEEERARIMDPYIAVYKDHLDRMWAEVARRTGLGEDRVRKAGDEIVHRIALKEEHIYATRLTKEMTARLARGEEISADVEDDVKDRLKRPIAEEQTSHILLPNITDDAGFALMRMCAEKVDLPIPDGHGGMTTDKNVARMPGLAVVPSGDRDYPLDRITVDVDLSTLPEPVRGTGKKSITVDGVAYHVIGRMKDQAQKEDNDRRRVRAFGGKLPGHENEPDVPPDAAFAERVLTHPRDINEAEDRGRYFDEDAAGLTGVEASQEDTLRGLRGLRMQQLETSETTTVPPERGRDVQLTLDAMLQARVQAAMSPQLGLAISQPWHGSENPTVPVGTPLNGAAVVLEVDTGDILALVSTPSISREELRDHPEKIFDDPVNREADVPWIDRAIGRPYPPGSIAKAVILNAAVKLGKHSLDSHIECNGHLFPDKPNMFRCWIYKSHGGYTHTQQLGHALSAPEALMVSCNIFFFTVGQRLGPAGAVQAYRMFGLGEPLDLGIDPNGEFEGFLGSHLVGGQERPSPASAPGTVSQQDAIQMGIGQGPVSWTPLHAADAYCTLARGGVRIKPHVINEPTSPQTQDLELDHRALKEAMQGLWMSINEDQGTGNHLAGPEGRRWPHFHFNDLTIWGKTGTATAPTLVIHDTIEDPHHKGEKIPNPLWDKATEAGPIAEASKNPEFKLKAGTRALRWGDHSWFVVLVGPKTENRPKYAIAVMMEYAGSGGKVSGPIVNQIILALKAEGYL
jgi:cell division protein FtsI/penicillin-binding protein 2